MTAVDLWSYPNPGSGTYPQYLGSGNYGVSRPDVATAFGARFQDSGYSKSVSGLAAGEHLFLRYAYSPTNGWFVTTTTNYVDVATVGLTIDRQGAGTGGVTASGLTCVGGSTTQAVPCGANYPLHTVVTLTAVPDANSTFAGWGGACTGSGTCQVTLSMARFVTATFTKLPDTIATRYYHTDVIGSVRAITDEAGGVVARNDTGPSARTSRRWPAIRIVSLANSSIPKPRCTTSTRGTTGRRGGGSRPWIRCTSGRR